MSRQSEPVQDTGLALDQAMKAGQLGGFELKDMAKWLPQQMAMARQSGLTGDAGFRTLLAANQAAAITAGTKDEAGNNLVNLLGKINSQDTAKDAARLGIDLSGTLANARGKGVNSLDAFVNMTEQIVGRDKNYVALREKARTATGDEKKATLESMGDILQGSSIGKIVQDRQALMALLGIMGNRGYMNDVQGKLGNAQGTAADAHALIAGTAGYQAEQYAAEKAIATQKALGELNPLLGKMAEGVTGLMRDFPVLAAAAEGTSLGVRTLGAAAFAAAASLALLGGGGAAKGVMSAGKWALAAGTAAAPAVAGVAAAGAAGYAVGTGINWVINKTISGATGRDETLGGLIYDMTHGDDLKKNAAPPVSMSFQDLQRPLRSREGASAVRPVDVRVKVDVENGNIVASVNEYNARQASRN